MSAVAQLCLAVGLDSIFFPPQQIRQLDSYEQVPAQESSARGTGVEYSPLTEGRRVPQLSPGRTSGAFASHPLSLHPSRAERSGNRQPRALEVGQKWVLTLGSRGREASLLCPRVKGPHPNCPRSSVPREGGRRARSHPHTENSAFIQRAPRGWGPRGTCHSAPFLSLFFNCSQILLKFTILTIFFKCTVQWP